jgi:catechol 2,3-dioxygenase-like lactoylglutathione lyase family enzyme
MKLFPSCCVAIQSPDPEAAHAFFVSVLGLEPQETAGEREVQAPPLRIFSDSGEPDVIFELLVDNADRGREELTGKGCKVVRWEEGGCRYLEDPFGFKWNLFEEPLDGALDTSHPKTGGKTRFSNCFALGVESREEGVQFYCQVFGFTRGKDGDDWTEVQAGPLRLFVCQGGEKGPIGSVDVRNRDEARAELEAAGCTVERWEPEKGCCFMRSPHGFVFDVHEDPDAFLE